MLHTGNAFPNRSLAVYQSIVENYKKDFGCSLIGKKEDHACNYWGDQIPMNVTKGTLRMNPSLILTCGPTKERPKVLFDPYTYILLGDFILCH